MKRTELGPDAKRRRSSRWTHLILGGILGFGGGIAPLGASPPLTSTDQTKVPHYFGPFPNWALSPLTVSDATVLIGVPPTGGTQATATAAIGANGVITGITIKNPGSGYLVADAPAVSITGSGTLATATATVNPAPAVTAITVTNGGAGYSTIEVGITDSTGQNAAATGYGGVDAVTVTAGGDGYTNPTVDFDLPDWEEGVAPVAHAVCDALPDQQCGGEGRPGIITAIIVDQPGSGYATAPHIVIRNGTIFDPILVGGGATATSTLTVQNVVVDAGGSDYSSTPTVSITDPSGDGEDVTATATATTDFGTISGIQITNAGSGYLTAGGIKKFQDSLPGLCVSPLADGTCPAADNNLGQFIPLAKADNTVFTKAKGFRDDADYYVIAVVQHRECMSSSMPNCGPNNADPTKPKGTLLREYVQLASPGVPGTVPLKTDLLDGSSVDLKLPNGDQAMGSLSPTISAPSSPRPRVSRSGSCSITSCRKARVAICISPPTRP